MTIRRRAPDGNLPGGHESETQQTLSGGQTLLTQRAALILLAAVAIGLDAGILAWLAGTRPAAAVLVGGAACAAAITLLNTLIN